LTPIINVLSISKSFGSTNLFQNLSFVINQGDRLGLIGPNGAGKSTLLQILAGSQDIDSGEVALRKNTRLAYVAQDSVFPSGISIRQVAESAMQRVNIPVEEREGVAAEALGRAGFVDFQVEAASLSGGWRKRLAIVEGIVQRPDILLLDEPTNHLDLTSIVWLEQLLSNAEFGSIIVSHDRYFLENTVNDMMELNRRYVDGLLRFRGDYSNFLQKKQEFLAAQAKQQESLESKVRVQLEWLQRGARARRTKAKAQIDNAMELIGELADMKSRGRTSVADLDFTASDRKTKRLAAVESLEFSIGGKKLFDGLSFAFTAGTRIGLVGPNGSGKTTLLRLLRGELKPDSGQVQQADYLKIVYFDQNRHLDPTLTLRRSLAPDSDSVVYQGRPIHVAAWADRFLFDGSQLDQPVSRLSGGERARVLIAKLMLEPADLLLLDEPTNDLDIQTLELLEERLLEFSGALILVTHDRYLLDRVSTLVLGLDGKGRAQRFADYAQWEVWQAEIDQPAKPKSEVSAANPVAANKKKLSYMEQREYDGIEAKIAEAESKLADLNSKLLDPAVASSPSKLAEFYDQVAPAEAEVARLYSRWQELEEKLN
jgi:ABC transport system ATP-binding/permease protein